LVGGDTISGAQSYNSMMPQGTNGSVLSVANYALNDGNNGGNYLVTAVLSAKGTIDTFPSSPGVVINLPSMPVEIKNMSTQSVSENIRQTMDQGNWALRFDPKNGNGSRSFQFCTGTNEKTKVSCNADIS